MKIEVTQEHIYEGERFICTACPVALAIKSVVPRGTYVVVSQAIGVGTRVFDIPQNALDFIGAFDAGMTVEPFSFELEI